MTLYRTVSLDVLVQQSVAHSPSTRISVFGIQLERYGSAEPLEEGESIDISSIHLEEGTAIIPVSMPPEMNRDEPVQPLLDFAAYQSYDLSVYGNNSSAEEDPGFELLVESARLNNLPQDPRQPFGVRCVFHVSRAALDILAGVVSGPGG